MKIASKKIYIAVLAVLLTAFCAIGGVLLSGHLSKSTDVPQEPTEEISLDALPVGEKVAPPLPVRATRIYISEDADLTDSMQDIVSTGFNGVVFLGSRKVPALSVENAETLRPMIAAARAAGLYTSVMLEYTQDTAALSAFAASCGTDGLIFRDLYNALAGDVMPGNLRTALEPTSVSTVLADLPFTALRAAEGEKMLDTLRTLFRDGILDGIYTESVTASDSTLVDYDATLAGWKTAIPDKQLWIGQSEDFVNAAGGSACVAEPLKQLSAVLKTPELSAVFCAFADFNRDAEALQTVRSCLQNGPLAEVYFKAFRVTNHKDTSFTTNESKVTFTGECSPKDKLTCNGKTVPVTEDGFFSVEYGLSVGKNTFVFYDGAQKYTYNVQYVLDLIRSITPDGSLSSPGGAALEIAVVAHRKASVYATLNGTKIALVGSNALMDDSEGGGMTTASDYVTFTGTFKLPASSSKAVSLGSIKAYASYQGITDSVTGARVSVTANAKIEALPVLPETPASSSTAFTTARTTLAPTTTTTTKPTTTATTSEPAESAENTDLSESEPISETQSSTTQKTTASTTQTTTKPTTGTQSQSSATTAAPKLDPVITPYSYNGIAGTKRMCVIKTYYTETMPLSPLNDLSVPTSTPLLTGTFDFITGESSYGSYTYYNLGSGRRVYRKDVEVIEKAYAMPANTITVIHSGTSGSSTSMNLHLKWKVPFNVELRGQKYINDPKNGRVYAVSALNANSLDITFCYTAKAVGVPDVTASGVIQSCEWLQSASAQTATLRLYLRNASRFYGYSVSYNADNTLHISIKEKNGASVSGKTVMLDPGHGGSDGGAPCAVNSSTWNEAKINLAIAQKVRTKLQAMGADVMMTRTANTDLTLENRKKTARQNNPDVFVSIHCDAAESSGAYGTSAYYYRAYSQSLGKAIHARLVTSYVNTLYGTNKSTIDRGTIFYPFSVCRIEECPSVLIECGYVSNLNECKILQSTSAQETIAAGIANGINDYFANN